MKNQNETDDITMSVEDQIDIAYGKLTEATIWRLHHLCIPPFTEKYILWNAEFEKDSSQAEYGSQFLEEMKLYAQHFNSLTDEEFKAELGGVINPELIGKVDWDDMINIYLYIMENLSEWINNPVSTRILELD